MTDIANMAYNGYSNACQGWNNSNQWAMGALTQSRDGTAIGFGASQAAILLTGACVKAVNYASAMTFAVLEASGLQISIGLQGLVCQRDFDQVWSDVTDVNYVFIEAPGRNYAMATTKASELWNSGVEYFSGQEKVADTSKEAPPKRDEI